MKLKTIFFGALAFLIFWIILPLFMLFINQFFRLPVFNIRSLQYLGIVFLLIDGIVFAYCNRLFMKYGKGTFMPTEGTKKVVYRGLYAHLRNPIYAGHLLGFTGIFLLFGHILLLFYVFLAFLFIHLIVVYLEEPDLKKRFGTCYVDYTKKVRRWGFF